MVFSAENARNPQLKITIDGKLFVDLSCAVVSNRDFEGMLGQNIVSNLIGMDEDSIHSL